MASRKSGSPLPLTVQSTIDNLVSENPVRRLMVKRRSSRLIIDISKEVAMAYPAGLRPELDVIVGSGDPWFRAFGLIAAHRAQLANL